MHIIGGQVQSQSQHQFSHHEQRLGVQQRVSQPQARSNTTLTATPLTALQQQTSAASSAPSAGGETDTSADKDLSLLKALVEALTGKVIDTLDLGDTSPASADVKVPTPASAASSTRVVSVEAVHISESESTQVAFSGQFDTADGSHIDLDLEYTRERSYEATTVSTTAVNGNAKDPIALNFDGLGVALDAKRTQFDLNGDGATESIATLAAGSAYLALDRNGNGRIDNGRELFGPITNNGYAELAKLDSDGNGFIDSADPLFSKLLLFRPGDTTTALSDTDVGAISLSNTASAARLTDRNNQSLGQLRATGFYLTNQGGAGLVQQLDLTV